LSVTKLAPTDETDADFFSAKSAKNLVMGLLAYQNIDTWYETVCSGISANKGTDCSFRALTCATTSGSVHQFW